MQRDGQIRQQVSQYVTVPPVGLVIDARLGHFAIQFAKGMDCFMNLMYVLVLVQLLAMHVLLTLIVTQMEHVIVMKDGRAKIAQFTMAHAMVDALTPASDLLLMNVMDV